MLLQLAAIRVGKTTWFEDYALLGDDIVIADEAVAIQYHWLLQTYLGVDINLSKSLVSDKGAFEFAKRLITLQGEFTPLGPKNIVLALKRATNIPSLFIDGLGKGDSFSAMRVKVLLRDLHPDLIRLSRLGKVSLTLALLKPFGIIDSPDVLGSLRTLKSFEREDVYELFRALGQVMAENFVDDFNKTIEESIEVLKSLSKDLVVLGDVILPFNAFPSYRSLYDGALLTVVESYTRYFPKWE